MKSVKSVVQSLLGSALVASSLLIVANPVVATEQAQQRRAARDNRQDTRPEARQEKVDCRAANQKSNAACRHDKRETKQDGRQQARDIKY